MAVEDLSETINDVAQAPAEMAGEGQSVKEHPIPDLIAADRYAKSEAAVSGSNANGGPKSAWASLRPARARFRDPT